MGLFGYRLLLKIENWKYYNKIIFKCVNSAVGPSFKVILPNSVLVGPMNNTQNPLFKMQTQVSLDFSYIQTHTMSVFGVLAFLWPYKNI